MFSLFLVDGKSGVWPAKKFQESAWFINQLRKSLNLSETDLYFEHIDEAFLHFSLIILDDWKLNPSPKYIQNVARQCAIMHKRFRRKWQKGYYQETEYHQLLSEVISKSRFIKKYYHGFRSNIKRQLSLNEFTKIFWFHYNLNKQKAN